MQDQNSRPHRGRTNTRIRLHVPAKHVEAVYEELLALRAVRAESAANEHHIVQAGFGSPCRLDHRRNRLADVDALVEQVDWAGRRQDDPVEVEGDRWLLGEIIRGALLWASERIAEACHRPPDRGFSIAEIAGHHEQLGGLLMILRELTADQGTSA